MLLVNLYLLYLKKSIVKFSLSSFDLDKQVWFGSANMAVSTVLVGKLVLPAVQCRPSISFYCEDEEQSRLRNNKQQAF